MADLQNGGVQIDTRREEPAFGRDACIAREEHPKGAVFEHERYRVVVDVVAGVREERQLGSDEAQGDAVAPPDRAGARIDDRHRIGARGRDGVAIGAPAVRLSAVRERSDAQDAQRRRDPAGVIAVRVAQDDGVERVDAVPQQERHDDPLADAFRG